MNKNEISLTEILASRDRREELRRKFLLSSPGALLQLGVNIPGSLKNSAAIKEIFTEGINLLTHTFKGRITDSHIAREWKTGPEGFLILDMEAERAKEICSTLEETHPLGRLWDVDLYRPSGTLVSRQDLSLPPRKCFLCDRPAHECSRSRTHDLDDLSEYIFTLYSSYRSQKDKSELK